jgi:hypothetical protein
MKRLAVAVMLCACGLAVSAAAQSHAHGRRPTVVVSPSRGLRDRRLVTVRATGFPSGVKVFLSECASAADAGPEGCGLQMAQQPLFLTAASGTRQTRFTVRSVAPTRAYSTLKEKRCVSSCVIVAVADTTAHVWADETISFAPSRASQLSEHELLEIGLRAARQAGDSRPTLVQYAEGSRARDNVVTSGDIVPGGESCFLIAVRGHFIAKDAITPPGAKDPTGSVLTLVVDAKTGEQFDFSIGDKYPRLAKLGRVVTAKRS